MKFSCLPAPILWSQRKSINLLRISRRDSESPLSTQSINKLPETPVEPTLITVPKVLSTKAPAPQPPNISKGTRSSHERKTGIIEEGSTLEAGSVRSYEKDAKSKEQIKNAILKNDFLKHLEKSQIQDLVMAMHPEKIPPGRFVIRQGDMGSNLYVSAEGEFNVYNEDILEDSFGPGVAFGELALLYNTKRLRSIEAKNGGKVWVLDRAAFRTVIMTNEQDRLKANIRYLRQIPFFATLSEDHVLAKISDLLRVELFQAGTRIIRQGDEGHNFYIIRNGTVEITKSMPYGGEEQLVVLKSGEYFGEKALLVEGESKRQANAIALSSTVECLTLDRASFLKYLGALEEIRTKDWNAVYEKQRKSQTLNWSSEYKNLKFGDLEVVKTLGVGGFGRVDLVVPKYIQNKSFALKRLKKMVIVNKDLQESVFNEKYIMQACTSPFICKLYNTYKDTKYVYFLMEVCLGGDVWTTLQRRRQFDDPTVRFMTACVVEALDHLHSLGIVYRDLKPENLMLDSRGYIKLVDFGLSKKIGHYKTWGHAGTPEYAAPEVLLKKGHDRAVDYWALGILTHELLVGKPPFRGRVKDRENPMPVYIKILKGIDVVGIPANVSRSANDFIRKLLQANRSDRLGYQSKGIQEIRDHEWFDGFNWNALRKMTLSAPIVPKIRSHVDTSNFEEYPPDKDIPCDESSGWDKDF